MKHFSILAMIGLHLTTDLIWLMAAVVGAVAAWLPGVCDEAEERTLRGAWYGWDE